MPVHSSCIYHGTPTLAIILVASLPGAQTSEGAFEFYMWPGNEAIILDTNISLNILCILH